MVQMILIPQIFHRIWLGDKEMPEEFVYYGETWKKLHPSWKIKLWTEENIPKLINQEAFDNAKLVAQKSDILRYECLFREGGTFVCTDFEAYRNIAPLLDNVDCFSASEAKGFISIGIMGCTPKHPIFKRLIDNLPQSIEDNKDKFINEQTGPGYMTRTVSFDEIKVFPPELFYPVKFPIDVGPDKGADYPNAYANHHWSGSWLPEGWR